MNLNAVLMKFFNLPPAMKMLLAVAGFGSLASILFWILPALKTPQARMWILIVGGIGLLAFLIVAGVRRTLFSRKSRQLSSALASQGPTRGDIAEQEQLYREKFNAKLNELRNHGLSVYRLPWFVLMGEPGCGKTASLIHSGLDFPLGKDEVPGFGGTRNYNWWFTNEAVILDTAGRIAFQEEGTTDKIEWEYFLKLLKRNRTRCPINGVIVAVPADKLLRDSAEERANKASILRERLRQIHQQLGVRFPTFVLVTKMDLVGGFSEFCEEIRVDLQQRNQMFGWSRPGEFQAPYDPAGFPEAFQQLYARVRDWALYYMHKRRATEQELGMVVTFPESFRQLGPPLADYIGTIFQKSPLLEPPFFRGVYFTSAVQEGAPIFDVFTRSRAGHAIAERPRRAVDSKAFFIHDFYAKKVFPEHGLVFRSARHVALNRRARRLVWIGSAAMCALLLTIFGFGYYGVRGLVKNPRETVERAVKLVVEAGNADINALANNLEVAESLKRHIDAYNSPWSGLFARMLFLGANIDQPRSHVQTVHARFVLDCILRPVVREVEQRMQSSSLPATGIERDAYLAALATYARWYGELAGQHNLPSLDPELGEAKERSRQFALLMGAAQIGQEDRGRAAAQLQVALESFSRGLRGQATFATNVLRDRAGFSPGEMGARLKTAIENLERNWEPQARIAAGSASGEVQYWANFATLLQGLRDAYIQLLATGRQFLQQATTTAGWTEFDRITRRVAVLNEAAATIPADAGELTKAFSELRSFLKNNPAPQDSSKRIIRMTGLAELISRLWTGEFQKLENELGKGAPRDKGAATEVYAALDAARGNLNKAVQASLSDLLKRLGLDDPSADPLTYFSEQGLLTFKEATGPGFEGDASISLAPTALGPGGLVVTYLTELAGLADPNADGNIDPNDLSKWSELLSKASGNVPASGKLGEWFKQAMQGQDKPPPPDNKKQHSSLPSFWQPEKLYDLADSIWTARRDRTMRELLEKMKEKAEKSEKEKRFRGIGQLMRGYNEPDPNLPFQMWDPNKSEPQDKQDKSLVARSAQPQQEQRLLLRYHTREFRSETLSAYEDAREALEKQKGQKEWSEAAEGALKALDSAAAVYVRQYFEDWNAVYSDARKLLDPGTLQLLADCRDARDGWGWKKFSDFLTENEKNIKDEFSRRMSALIREVADFKPDSKEGRAFQRLKNNKNIDESDIIEYAVVNHVLDLQKKKLKGSAGASPNEAPAILEEALDNYIDLVRDVDKDPNGAPEQPPTRQGLLDELTRNQKGKEKWPENFALTAPLLDLAKHGEELLKHELRSQLYQRFRPLEGRFPVVADPYDASTDLRKLSDLGQKAADPNEFIKLLRELAEFRRERGKLVEKLFPENDPVNDSVRRSLDLAGKWAAFLYKDPNSLRNKDPERIELTLAVAKPGDVTAAGAAYDNVEFYLPLIEVESDKPAGPIKFGTRAGAVDGKSQYMPSSVDEALKNVDFSKKFDWQLKSLDFGAPGAKVTARHPDALKYPEEAETQWGLPRQPLSLLMLIDSRRENRREDGKLCVIPVRIQLGSEVIGFDVGIQFKREYPGVIPPPPDPGAVPKMSSAEKYLKGPE